jgi:hypothetical protein
MFQEGLVYEGFVVLFAFVAIWRKGMIKTLIINDQPWRFIFYFIDDWVMVDIVEWIAGKLGI